MKQLKSKKNILLVLTAAAILFGCCPRPMPLELSPPPPLFLDQAVYPETFKTIHRCTLSIGGRTMVFNGYLKVDRSLNSIKCAAQTDMGATLFKYAWQAGKLEIFYCSPGFKPDWIKAFALRDASLLLLPRSSATLARGTTQESILDDSRLSRYIVRKADTEIYTAVFTNYKEDWPNCRTGNPAMADTIIITDNTLGYRLEIRVMDLLCTPENDS